jgi:hypothetical protein
MATLAPPPPPVPLAAAPARSRWWTIAFAASGVVPLLGMLQHPPQTTLLIYSVFVGVLLVAPRAGLQGGAAGLTSPAAARFTAAMLAAGLVAEVLAWFNEYAARKAAPALFHPQLVPDLILVSGLFLGWAAAWLGAASLYRFGLREVFVTTGVLGVAIEQNGAVMAGVVQLLTVNPLQSLVMATFVFLVYGSITGLAFVAAESRLPRPPRRGWLKYPLACAFLFAGGKAGAWIVRIVADALHLIGPVVPIGS